ncbi:Ulp1 protease family, C-terminal catalytic domain [Sesbania bispinosa]|nr:Ulp1 protease family, C-terminal catalytic domain [Sesbania bispinosa]
MSHPVTRSRRKALDSQKKVQMEALDINLDSSEDEDHNEYLIRDSVTVQPGANPTVGTTGTHTVPTAGSPTVGKTFTMSKDFGGNLLQPHNQTVAQAHHLVAASSEFRRGTQNKDAPTKSNDKGKATDDPNRFAAQRKRNVSWTHDGQVLPGFMRCNLKPSADMASTHTQLQMCAYVFHPEREPQENIFSGGGIDATREDFACICPGKTVTEKRHVKTPDVWCLPPTFARDILTGHSTTEIMTKYCDEWMPTSNDLKFIYVPITDNKDHWFLIVMNIEEHKIFHLDSPLSEVSSQGEDIIMTVESEKFTKAIGDLISWPATVRGGLRNTTDNSVVWVLSWIDMEYAFNPKLVALGVTMSVGYQLSRGLVYTGVDVWCLAPLNEQMFSCNLMSSATCMKGLYFGQT